MAPCAAGCSSGSAWEGVGDPQVAGRDAGVRVVAPHLVPRSWLGLSLLGHLFAGLAPHTRGPGPATARPPPSCRPLSAVPGPGSSGRLVTNMDQLVVAALERFAVAAERQ